MKKLNKTRSKDILLGITIIILFLVMYVGPTSAESLGMQEKTVDSTEGGHLETDFGVNFMAEWWYLNGEAILVASDGEKRDIGFFIVWAHQESPMFNGVSQLLTFYGLYFEDGTTTFDYVETNIPKEDVDQYISLHTPYVDYRYPDGLKEIYGTALTGYDLNYMSNDTNVDMDLLFKTNIDKTIDQADEPLNFTTYEHSYGTLHGSILLDGKRYIVTHGEGYMDHMIPISSGPWPMDMHGWTWFEVTTKKYQAVAYAVRGLDDGYDDYSYKHLILLNKHNGKVLAEYSADEIMIIEPENPNDWYDWEPYYGGSRKRPSMVEFSTPGLNVTVEPETVVYFDLSNPNKIGFVDFMTFQLNEAAIQYNGNIEQGSAFYEYLVTDMGASN
jgi:hypothetical protein